MFIHIKFSLALWLLNTVLDEVVVLLTTKITCWQSWPWRYASTIAWRLTSDATFHVCNLELTLGCLVLSVHTLEVMGHRHHIVISMGSSTTFTIGSSCLWRLLLLWHIYRSRNTHTSICCLNTICHCRNDMLILNWSKCRYIWLEPSISSNWKIMTLHKLSINHQLLIFVLGKNVFLSSVLRCTHLRISYYWTRTWETITRNIVTTSTNSH